MWLSGRRDFVARIYVLQHWGKQRCPHYQCTPMVMNICQKRPRYLNLVQREVIDSLITDAKPGILSLSLFADLVTSQLYLYFALAAMYCVPNVFTNGMASHSFAFTP